jgi:energy-converting hydrogenase Eha subunit G
MSCYVVKLNDIVVFWCLTASSGTDLGLCLVTPEVTLEIQKLFKISHLLLYRILQHIYGALNIDKKITNCTVYM